MARPLLSAFIDALDPDLVAASTAYRLRGRPGRGSLSRVIAAAVDRGTETLVVSSELFDRVQPQDRGRLAEALGGHDLTLVLTVTKPVHRWCVGWQTLVRHGLPHYPADAARHIYDFAGLLPGRLGEIAGIIPAQACLIRLVRPLPPELDLAASLAQAVGLPHVDVDAPPRVLNPSLGVDIEVVLRINRSGLGLGTDRASREVLTRLKGKGFAYHETPHLAERYALPQQLSDAAALEQAWLRGLPQSSDSRMSLLDPHGLLDTWTDHSVPDWYATVSRREAVAPELNHDDDPYSQLWRLRQELHAYKKFVDKAARFGAETGSPAASP